MNIPEFLSLTYDVFDDCKHYVANKQALQEWLKLNKIETYEDADNFLVTLVGKYPESKACIFAIAGLDLNRDEVIEATRESIAFNASNYFEELVVEKFGVDMNKVENRLLFYELNSSLESMILDEFNNGGD